MDFKRLKYFLTVAEELNFGRAAARLDLAQPVLSRQIAALEDTLGVPLFDRSRSQIQLTQAGTVFRDHARFLTIRLETALYETRRIGSGSAGQLRIAFIGSASFGALADVTRRYREDNPGVELEMVTAQSADLKRMLVEREADIAVTYPPIDYEEFRQVPFASEPLCLALKDGTDLAEQTEIQLSDLAGQDLVLFPRQPRPGHADAVLDLFSQAGVVPGDSHLAQDCLSAISQVAIGVGIAMVPRSLAVMAHPGVVYRPYKGPNPGIECTLHARLDNRAVQVMQFLDIARKFSRGG